MSTATLIRNTLPWAAPAVFTESGWRDILFYPRTQGGFLLVGPKTIHLSGHRAIVLNNWLSEEIFKYGRTRMEARYEDGSPATYVVSLVDEDDLCPFFFQVRISECDPNTENVVNIDFGDGKVALANLGKLKESLRFAINARNWMALA